MVRRILIFFLLLFSFGIFHAQQESCTESSYFKQIRAVQPNSLKCLAENSTKKSTIFLTFARWCEPCLYKVYTFFNLEKDYDVDLYILMMDPENQEITQLGMEYILGINKNANILIVKDKPKKGKRKKYRDFLKEITPPQMEVIDDMGKWIVYDNNGEIKLITSYKDTEKDADKYDREMVNRLIIPMLHKKD